MNLVNQARNDHYTRAEYFAWSARRSTRPTGMDPLTGRPYPWSIARAISRAQDKAAAEVCYAMARTIPSPLP